MSNKIKENWSRLATEALVIIVSVLAALALDDWRDARADRDLERHLLETLKEDLTADLEELDSSLESAIVTRLASGFLLGATDEYTEGERGPLGVGLSRLLENVPDSGGNTQEQAAVSALVGGIDFDLSDLTYQEMMSTGSFRVIRNNELRHKITRYYWFVRSFNITNSSAESFRAGFADALLRNGVSPGRIDTARLDEALEDRQLRALLRQLDATAQTMHEVHTEFVDQARQLLAEIEAELSK